MKYIGGRGGEKQRIGDGGVEQRRGVKGNGQRVMVEMG